MQNRNEDEEYLDQIVDVFESIANASCYEEKLAVPQSLLKSVTNNLLKFFRHFLDDDSKQTFNRTTKEVLISQFNELIKNDFFEDNNPINNFLKKFQADLEKDKPEELLQRIKVEGKKAFLQRIQTKYDDAPLAPVNRPLKEYAVEDNKVEKSDRVHQLLSGLSNREAIESLKTLLELPIAESLYLLSPSDLLRILAHTYKNYALEFDAQNQFDAALTQFQHAIATINKISPLLTLPSDQQMLAEYYIYCARMLDAKAKTVQLSESINLWQAAIAWTEKVPNALLKPSHNIEFVDYRFSLIKALYTQARGMFQSSNFEKAALHFRLALQEFEKIPKDYVPQEYAEMNFHIQNKLAQVFFAQSFMPSLKLGEIIHYLREAIRTYEMSANYADDDTACLINAKKNLCGYLQHLAAELFKQNRNQESLKCLEEAIAIFKQIPEEYLNDQDKDNFKKYNNDFNLVKLQIIDAKALSSIGSSSSFHKPYQNDDKHSPLPNAYSNKAKK